jgi:hypothetical protein
MHPQPLPDGPRPRRPCICWAASGSPAAPRCGWQLTTARIQRRCERRAARRLTNEPGYLPHARTLERLSGELAEVLARLIATDQHHPTEPAP